jgi:hypothetical protein
MSQPNIYSYTAASNPYFVRSLAHRYGYEFEKDQPLETVLQQLVSYEGEPVLVEIIENNPDKDLFMDYFDKIRVHTIQLEQTCLNHLTAYCCKG